MPLDALLALPWIGFDPRGSMRDLFRNADARFEHVRFVLGTDSLTAHVEAAKSGLGVAGLQRPVAHRAGGLVEIPLPGSPPVPLWLATHQDLRNAPHVRAVHGWPRDVLERYLAV